MPASFKEFSGQQNGRDITRAWVDVLGDFMPTQNQFLLEKSGGNINVLQPVLENPRIRACYIQRFSGLTSKELEVVPGGDKKIDRLAAEHIQHQLENNFDWDTVTEQMMYAVHNGYAIAEPMYAREDGKVVLSDIKVRDPFRFHFGSDMLPRLKTFGKPTGDEIPPQKIWHMCYGSTHGDEPYGRPLGTTLYWIDWFQRNLKKWQITYLENYADPSTIGHYPIGATDVQKKTLEGAVKNIGKTKWATLPEGMLIELLEASRAGNADYQSFHDSLDTAASTLILGQNMTSESGSSEAQANVHMDVGDRIIEADDAMISSSFNASVVTWLTNWNFPGAAIPRVRRKLEPPDDLKAMADRDAVIVNMGFPLDPEYVVKTYGEGFKAVESDTAQTSLNGAQLQAFVSLITSAQQGGWSSEMVRTALLISFPRVPQSLIDEMAGTMKGMPPVDPNADPNNPQPPSPTPQPPNIDNESTQFAAPKPDLIDGIVDRLTTQDHFRPWLNQAKELLMKSSDLNEFSDKLDTLYPDLSSAEFAEAMRQAMTVSSMGGYHQSASEDDGEVEFKLPEGSKKTKNGVEYILTSSRWRRADAKPKSEKKSKAEPRSKYEPGHVGDIPIGDISADPKRFQYKLLGAHTKTGEVGSLSGVQKYDPNLAGIVQTWKDPADGKLYIINGHNRLALAQRAGAEKVTARVIDAPDAATARGIGALTNIAEGRGTALDAAKFFRDSGLTAEDIKKKGIPLREKIATDGLGIAALEPQLFNKVVEGELSESRAALLGRTGLTGAQQVDLYKLSETKTKKGKLTDDAFRELAESVKASQSSQGTLFDLFGASTVEKSNALERASLSASIKQQMSRDKKLFGLVSKTKVAQDLDRAGNQIDKEGSGKIADQASQLLGVFDQLKNTSGGISSVLNSYASQVSDGKMTPAKAKTDAYKEIAELIKTGKL
jgi:phage gp29-like protein